MTIDRMPAGAKVDVRLVVRLDGGCSSRCVAHYIKRFFKGQELPL
ncbi:MAG: hypothetical protein AB7G68_16430 [Nitrospiraceae bacterium]